MITKVIFTIDNENVRRIVLNVNNIFCIYVIKKKYRIIFFIHNVPQIQY